MRKLLILIILISLTAGCGIFNLNGWIVPDDGEFLAIVKELNTPHKISNYMLANFTYEIHDFTALSPYELFLYKKGDCDIFAIFGIYIANYHCYETFIIHIFDVSFYSHYVAVYNENIYYSITNSRHYYFGFDNFREIVEYVCYITDRDWTKYKVYDYWDNIIELEYNN